MIHDFAPDGLVEVVARHAGVALSAAIAQRCDDASRELLALLDIPRGLGMALQMWCDCYAHYAAGGRPDRTLPVSLAFAHEAADGSLGPLTDADDPSIQPEAIWAGRLITARFALDRDTYTALVTVIPEGQVGRYVWAVLSLVSGTLRTLPRGFACVDH